MKFSFAPSAGLIIVRAEVVGPSSRAIVRVALDTGAARSLLGPAVLSVIGINVDMPIDRIRMTSASGVELVPMVRVPEFAALGVNSMLRWCVIGCQPAQP